ncbi:alpha/beta fold hydrolase [Wenzhouxiangella sp. XN79A]|nr:alpha/beta fold hydrolase BchO [Wenzhouxiangella sp. XN79A]NKI34871.1 alpha/beta fold hydrolase [Wenzhouxiangella sp. XN79A]
MDWASERDRWPHADASRFVDVDGFGWHVQQMGRGPALLLLHGTGASTHSWRSLAPVLAQRFTVIAPDLPGHGFTAPAPRSGQTVPGMAAAVAALVEHLGVEPVALVGHSAGAAIAIRCCLDDRLNPASVIGINAALLPFRGPAGLLFPPLARLLFLNPFTPRVFARRAADRRRVERLLRGTGSALDPDGIDLYARLFVDPGHVAGTLGMMANWDLARFARDLPELDVPLLLIAAENDRTIPAGAADRVGRIVPGAVVERLPGLGHLAHEEDAGAVAERIEAFIARADSPAAQARQAVD